MECAESPVFVWLGLGQIDAALEAVTHGLEGEGKWVCIFNAHLEPSVATKVAKLATHGIEGQPIPKGFRAIICVPNSAPFSPLLRALAHPVHVGAPRTVRAAAAEAAAAVFSAKAYGDPRQVPKTSLRSLYTNCIAHGRLARFDFF